ncbi:hypothetical protein CBR_g44377 [Chara braunii]|uniref:Protein kinase domain-containing protein n=1 Tax=Chara braunii TaxID=69332 RepID=A0A388LXG5_CHABU|nr:hypothetical protein CBR_g44377 [Chara braunii]|eukprot:GBG86922.1 hypothetical protein CBR_g44377 [Chara braunii]
MLPSYSPVDGLSRRFSSLAVIANSDAHVVGRLLQAPTSEAPPSLLDISSLPRRVLINTSMRVVASHPSPTENCKSVITNLVVSPQKGLYYVLEQTCSNSNKGVTSIRKANLSRATQGPDSADDESTLLTYLWSYDQRNGSRIAERPNSTASVMGMALSKDGSHLILSVAYPSFEDSAPGWYSYSGTITSLSVSDSSRLSSSSVAFQEITEIGLDPSGERLVYGTGGRGGLQYIRVDSSGLQYAVESKPSIPPAAEGAVESKPSIPPAAEGAVESKPSNPTVMVTAVVAGTVVAVVIIASLICLWRRARRRPAGPERPLEVGEQATSSLIKDEALDAWGLMPSRVKQLPFRILSECTDKFSEGRRIGEKGAFGKVYRGSLDGKEVAIKVMTGELTDIKRSQFVAEVNTLRGLNHANLVQLVGYCVAGDHCILVYPFFRGGSLHGRLFPKAVSGRDAKEPDTDQSVESPFPPLSA